MKSGDLIQKVRGASDLSKIGVVISVDTNSNGYEIATVMVNNSPLQETFWLTSQCEVVEVGSCEVR